MQVKFHKNFLLGQTNDRNLLDYGHLNDETIQKITLLIWNIQNNLGGFCGANKSSDNHISYERRNTAQKSQLFHYHLFDCRNNCRKNNPNDCKDFLTLKPNSTDSKVLHYLVNKNNDEIIFIGFSPFHDQGEFPNFKIQPLLSRLNNPPAKSSIITPEGVFQYLTLSKNIDLSINFEYYSYTCKIIEALEIDINNRNEKFVDLENKLISLFHDFIKKTCDNDGRKFSQLTTKEIKTIYQDFSS